MEQLHGLLLYYSVTQKRLDVTHNYYTCSNTDEIIIGCRLRDFLTVCPN